MMRSFRLIGLLALALAPAPAAAQQDVPFQVKLIVPAYFYPSDQPKDPGAKAWATLIDSHAPDRKVEVLPIANVNSGEPGTKADANYQRVIAAAAKKKMTVLAYLSTRYAAVPLATVKKNADAYLKLYPQIGGFFLDEQSSAAKDAEYYADLCASLRQKKQGAFLVGNPGTYVESSKCLSLEDKRVFDVVILRENSVKGAPFADYRNPEWASTFRPDRFGVIFHGSEKMRYAETAREKKVGYLYVTDGTLVVKGQKVVKDTRYSQLPSYWSDELKAIATVNAKK